MKLDRFDCHGIIDYIEILFMHYLDLKMKMVRQNCYSMNIVRWMMFVMDCMVNDVKYYMSLRLL